MNYHYPRTQSIFKNTVFLMEETVISGKYKEYYIPYEKNGTVIVKNISHEVLQKLIADGIVKSDKVQGSFNDKSFIRIPILIQQTFIWPTN